MQATGIFIGIALLIGIAIWFSGCIGPGSITTVQAPTSGSSIPQVEGINLFGETVTIPDDLEGEILLIAYAFFQQQQPIVNTWIDQVDSLREAFPDLRFYEIPVIGEVNLFVRLSANNGMRSGIPDPEKRATTITVYLDKEEFRDWMDMPDEDDIYIILYNTNAQELWRTRGRATDASVQELKTALLEHTQSP